MTVKTSIILATSSGTTTVATATRVEETTPEVSRCVLLQTATTTKVSVCTTRPRGSRRRDQSPSNDSGTGQDKTMPRYHSPRAPPGSTGTMSCGSSATIIPMNFRDVTRIRTFLQGLRYPSDGAVVFFRESRSVTLGFTALFWVDWLEPEQFNTLMSWGNDADGVSRSRSSRTRPPGAPLEDG